MMQRKSSSKVFDLDSPNEHLSLEMREKLLNKRLRNIIKYAYHNAPAVKNRLDSVGISPTDIRATKDLEKLPKIKKDDLIRLQREAPPYGGYLTVPLSELRRIYISPGPTYDVFSRNIAYSRYLYKELGSKHGDIVMITATYHMVPAGLVLDSCFDLLGITIVPTGPGQTELQVQIMRELGVTGYCGFPSFLMTIIQKAEELGCDFRRDFKLHWAMIMGERHGVQLRKVFENDYNLATWQSYGTADVGFAACECRAKEGMHILDDDMFIEICDPQTGKQLGAGEVGEIVATSFDKIYPLIRLGTGDLATYADEPCSCGRTVPRISNILGMVGDHIRVKGLFIHKGEVQELISKIPEIARVQAVITLSGHKDVIKFRLELKPESSIDEPAFIEQLNNHFQNVLKLRPDAIELLPQGMLPEDADTFVDKRW
ncbi:phenylacetate--CoA ligase family protein [Chloroflexota bacterium]